MSGNGVYIYENNTDGDLSPPETHRIRPTKSRTMRQRFQGDNYYMQWVKPPLNLLKFIDTVTVAEPKQLVAAQQTLTEKKMAEKKLILDQPDTIGHQGKIEHVLEVSPFKRLHDANDPDQKNDRLLTEDPLDGVEIILKDEQRIIPKPRVSSGFIFPLQPRRIMVRYRKKCVARDRRTRSKPSSLPIARVAKERLLDRERG